MKYKVAFWLTTTLAVLITAAGVAITFIGSGWSRGLPPTDYGRTPFLVGFVYFTLLQLEPYVWVCAALTFLAAYHFWRKSRGLDSPRLCVAYVASKGLLTVWMLCLAVGVAALKGADMEATRMYDKSGEMSFFSIQSVNCVPLVAVDLVLSIPLWLILILRSWRKEAAPGTETGV
jgi:hypothetical protein